MSIKQLIKNKNIKLTTARIALLDIFENTKKPISYEDIKNSLSMDKATFYRNVTKFQEEGILNSFESNDKKRYFEIHRKLHGHFVCVQCNALECIDDMELNLDGYEVNNIIINGICKECLSKS